MNYIRFQINTTDNWSTKPLGIFHALADLRDSGRMASYHYEHAQTLKERFNDDVLPAPDRFSRKKNQTKTKGISWRKETATIYLEKMREMVYLLEEYDITVEQIISDNPGYIIYEDEWQIVAEPFRESL